MFAIALGFFDGVHLGHGALLRRTRAAAEEKGLRSAALTFDRPPMDVVTGGSTPLINSLADRVDLIKRLYGIDEVIVLKFDRETMELPWSDFIDRIISENGAAHLVCGHDFSCGYKGAGVPELLRDYSLGLGVGFDVIPPVEIDGVRVSSTVIRELLLRGDVKKAAEYMGHPHVLTSPVRKGKGLARTFSTPTVNMYFDKDVLAPRYGVYAARIVLPDGTVRPAVTNVGIRPTVHDGLPLSAESYILDYSGTLYGETLRLEFVDFVRPERRFDSLDELHSQILADAERVRSMDL